jgi:hypothetical protein
VNTGVYNKSYQVYEGDQKTELLTNAKKEHSLLHMRYVARNGWREAKEEGKRSKRGRGRCSSGFHRGRR